MQIKRVLNWQLPLQRFWLSWCSGLNVCEALLWSGWVVVHAVGLWDLINYLFADTKYKACECRRQVRTCARGR